MVTLTTCGISLPGALITVGRILRTQAEPPTSDRHAARMRRRPPVRDVVVRYFSSCGDRFSRSPCRHFCDARSCCPPRHEFLFHVFVATSFCTMAEHRALHLLWSHSAAHWARSDAGRMNSQIGSLQCVCGREGGFRREFRAARLQTSGVWSFRLHPRMSQHEAVQIQDRQCT